MTDNNDSAARLEAIRELAKNETRWPHGFNHEQMQFVLACIDDQEETIESLRRVNEEEVKRNRILNEAREAQHRIYLNQQVAREAVEKERDKARALAVDACSYILALQHAIRAGIAKWRNAEQVGPVVAQYTIGALTELLCVHGIPDEYVRLEKTLLEYKVAVATHLSRIVEVETENEKLRNLIRSAMPSEKPFEDSVVDICCLIHNSGLWQCKSGQGLIEQHSEAATTLIAIGKAAQVLLEMVNVLFTDVDTKMSDDMENDLQEALTDLEKALGKKEWGKEE